MNAIKNITTIAAGCLIFLLVLAVVLAGCFKRLALPGR